jgi:hypothetical protein
MRRRVAVAITAAVITVVLTSYEAAALNRLHCIVEELAAAGFFDP